MTHAKYYPGADRSQWRGNGTAMLSVDKLLLHTTESSGWPSYPDFAPTLTFNPWQPRGKRWRQHSLINESATTLANAGTYRTNRANVCQIEIVAYCDPKRVDSSAHISRISKDAYHKLSEFFAWIGREWEVPIRNAVKWLPYPQSYGKDNPIRLSIAEFGTYKGLCGHMHAPGNSHGDPGALQVTLITSVAQQIKEDADMPTAKEIAAELSVNKTFLDAVATRVLTLDNIIENPYPEDSATNTHITLETTVKRIARDTRKA